LQLAWAGTRSIQSTPIKDNQISSHICWKPYHPYLPSNSGICEKRTRSLTRKLAQTPELLKTHGNIIAEQLTGGFIAESDLPQHCHFIPHHAVKKDSVTTPIRIVYDCSCRQSLLHPCLNDCLEVGPPFLIDLCTLLLHFQLYNIALVTDLCCHLKRENSATSSDILACGQHCYRLL